MASGVTYHYQTISRDSETFLVEAAPFMPEFRVDTGVEDGYIVEFNEGYIFDYANGGERKEFTTEEEEFKILDTEKKTYYLEMTIDDSDGAISEAVIKSKDTKEEGEGGEGGEEEEEGSDFTNLKNLSEIEGPTMGEDKKIKIDMAELEGPSISKLYVRENIHLWMRGFKQMGGAGEGVLKPTPSESGNDRIEFRELVEDGRDNNIIEISTVGDSINFFVPKPSGDQSSEHDVNVVASDEQDNRITVSSSTGSNGDVTYSLYVPPCSCESSSG